MTLHKLGIWVAGKDSKLQDSSRFVEIDNGLNILEAGTTFYFTDFDKERGFDKYKISRQMPKDPATASLSATFSADDKGNVKVKMQNLKDPSDPPREYPVEMTYGGGLYKQRYLLRIGKNLFPFLQYNEHDNDSYANRTRKQFRDYHADWFFDEATNKLKTRRLPNRLKRNAPPAITPATHLPSWIPGSTSPVRSMIQTVNSTSMAMAFPMN